MCNDVGKGAMATPETIVNVTKNVLQSVNDKQDLKRKTHKFGKVDTGFIMAGLLCVGVILLNEWRRNHKSKRPRDPNKLKWYDF